jgi:hypothetical protein
VRIQDAERSQRIFDASSLLYPAEYLSARQCAPAPNTLGTALLPSSFRNKISLQKNKMGPLHVALDLAQSLIVDAFFVAQLHHGVVFCLTEEIGT